MPDLLRSVTAGPFGIMFANVNTAMRLAGHAHHAEVVLTWRTLGAVGFPAFADTYRDVQARLIDLTARPFRDATNEAVADALWAGLDGWEPPYAARYGGSYQLASLLLRVRGVPDRIGHADGWTSYLVARPPGGPAPAPAGPQEPPAVFGPEDDRPAPGGPGDDDGAASVG